MLKIKPSFKFSFVLLSLVCCLSCATQAQLKVGAEQTSLYLPDLKGKSVGMVVNQTSVVGQTHLVDSLISLSVEVKAIFSPEHGFRGDADAGEKVSDGKDVKTGVPIVSLYGKNKKPSAEQIKDLDVIVFDIQDVGARFYTYLSTMHYVMEACAENDVDFIVLDRPNPNGWYVDGPVLDTANYRSFVGMHAIPIVHGMTLGELALMINNEGWLKNGVKCMLKVVPCQAYDHKMRYDLPIKPSPNLPNSLSINLYPSLCLFEATDVSIGRGTYEPFQMYGSPQIKEGEYAFVPQSIEGMSKSPKHLGDTCRGKLFREPLSGFDLTYLIEAYSHYKDADSFMKHESFFYKLAGTNELWEQIKNKVSLQDIKASWQGELTVFKEKRSKYLLYPDFE